MAQLPDDIGSGSIEMQVSGLVKVLEEEGHMPVLEATGAGSWMLISKNCPLGKVPNGCPAVCEAELEFNWGAHAVGQGRVHAA